MSERVESLHKQMSDMSLGDLCLLCGQAMSLGMDDKRLEIMFRYLEVALVKWKLKPKAEVESE